MFLILYTIVLDILILLLLGFISFFFIADRDFVHKDIKMKKNENLNRMLCLTSISLFEIQSARKIFLSGNQPYALTLKACFCVHPSACVSALLFGFCRSD